MFQVLKRLLTPRITWVLPQADFPTAWFEGLFKSEARSLDSIKMMSQYLGYQGKTDGFASIRASVDGAQRQATHWWCLDPIALVADMRTVMVTELLSNLDMKTLHHIQGAIQSSLPGGFHCECLSERLYLRADTSWEVETKPVSAVVGASMDACLPMGRDAKKVIQLMHEWQMILHALPLNQQRQSQGVSAITGLWLWGGGVLQAVRAQHWDRVVTNDPFVEALALAARLPVERVSGSLFDMNFDKFKRERLLIIDPNWAGGRALTPHQMALLRQAAVIETVNLRYQRRS